MTPLGRHPGAVVLAGAFVLAACGSDDVRSAEEAVPDAPPPTTAGAPTPAPGAAPGTTLPPTTTPRTTAPPPPTTPETTIPEPTSPSKPNEPAEGCRRLDDFDLDAGTWMIVNDGVMGGRSDGRGTIDDSTLRFFGTVVTAGGGFTSVRLRLDGTELDGTDRVRIQLRMDDRTYGVTFEDDQTIQGRRISHGVDLPEPVNVDADGFGIVEVAYGELRPSVFGQDVTAEPFRPDEASVIGIIIADGIDGDFAIDVDWIDVCARPAGSG